MGQRFRRSNEMLGAPLENTMLLLNAESGKYHALSPVAARIWEMLAVPVDEDRLVSELLAEYEVAPDKCQSEVASFLAQLRARGLLIVE